MTEERSPWKGAAVGAGGGSLLAAALGYIYGHRGKWLAYDALTGGALGGAAGYGIEKFNKDRIEEENGVKKKTPQTPIEEAKRKIEERADAYKTELYDKSKESKNNEILDVANTPEEKGTLTPIINLFDASKGDPDGPLQRFRRWRAGWYTRAGLSKDFRDFLTGNWTWKDFNKKLKDSGKEWSDKQKQVLADLEERMKTNPPSKKYERPAHEMPFISR